MIIEFVTTNLSRLVYIENDSDFFCFKTSNGDLTLFCEGLCVSVAANDIQGNPTVLLECENDSEISFTIRMDRDEYDNKLLAIFGEPNE